jgi:hypothetical protein
MTTGPVIAQVLEGENAVEAHRRIMGATDPKKADPGTIRRDFAASIEENVVHGSDAVETARQEIGFFFAQADICRGRGRVVETPGPEALACRGRTRTAFTGLGESPSARQLMRWIWSWVLDPRR